MKIHYVEEKALATAETSQSWWTLCHLTWLCSAEDAVASALVKAQEKWRSRKLYVRDLRDDALAFDLQIVSRWSCHHVITLLTIVALCNAVLYPSALSEVGDLRPVFVGIGIRTEGTACARNS